MKPFIYLFLTMLMLAFAGLQATAGGIPHQGSRSGYTLYPPQNLAGSAVECGCYLYWQLPQQPGGTTPPGLVGYYIYRDGIQYFYIPDGATVTYYDYMVDPGVYYTYSVTARYDLTAYGQPGQFGESAPAVPVTISINCDIDWPFQEYWDQGTFAFNYWQFTPTQSNWSVSTSLGNPLPTAMFSGLPVNQNCSSSMYTPSLPGLPWKCGKMYLEFDYKLDDIAANGTEQLSALYKIDNDWIQVFQVTNNGSTGWIHQKIDISMVNGKYFRVAFKAGGVNSANISAWFVDNIVVSHECAGPTACAYTQSANTIMLSWQPPECDSLQYIMGYNIYRTLEPNIQPLVKLNSAPVTATYYHDVLPTWYPSGQFLYLITALHYDPYEFTLLCEAPCDTLYVDYITGIDKHPSEHIAIYPNPADDFVRVDSDLPVEQFQISDIQGTTVLSGKSVHQSQLVIPIRELKAGMYLLTLKTSREIRIVKLAVTD